MRRKVSQLDDGERNAALDAAHSRRNAGEAGGAEHVVSLRAVRLRHGHGSGEARSPPAAVVADRILRGRVAPGADAGIYWRGRALAVVGESAEIEVDGAHRPARNGVG